MTDDPLVGKFGAIVPHLDALRAENEDFDELCADFVDLHRRVPDTAHAHSDALATLRALEEEIRRFVETAVRSHGEN